MKKKKGIREILGDSPINFFSDLFIVAMVLLWIGDCLFESIIATVVTLSSIVISHKTGTACYDTTMWTSIGQNIAVPLSAGGAIWMVKNAVQHALANRKGKKLTPDFPAVHAEGQDDGIEELIGGEYDEHGEDCEEADQS